ncbi:tape measure protein [Salmonella enterica subsp. enterica serovar Typhi]|uniref:Phage tail tape measure protein n=1 Tax=Salmonella enterica subsp. enterica serovar Typhi str. CT18 TaxID=220341 RepID=A0A717IRE9_SALTI|nr:tape measure protein [Escherichia coli]ECM8082267.1 tape measure protein [Salmonella enterica subsp. enterica serovar Typhi]EDW7840179.1 tape measure protein [Salmonella enterica]HAD4932325.1 phage tail tape measure protein [Salmonella enterica subsp. enterica serovar Typhi str. CT18]EDY6932633.1 tape measure protein [Salmonella enterica]EFH8027119.1 tape measure protein [Escherichia coli]
MSKFTVDSFIVELGFNENVIKGLQRVEKAALQSAQRIEKNLNKGFKINTRQLDSNLTSSLKSMEGKINKTFDRLEARAKNTKAFQFTTRFNDAINPPKQPRQPRISGNRAITAAYSANMTKLKGLNPIVEKYIKSQFYGLSAKAGSMDNSKFNEKLAQLNASVREAITKARGHTSTSINGNKAANSLDSLSSAAVKTAGAFISFQAVLSAYQRVMEVGLQRASSERSIDFVFGDQSTQVKKFIQDLTQITGMDTTETQAQFASFGASATTTMGLEGSEELFKNLTGYARLMGRSDEQIQRALTAVSQMASKGQVMAEELKGQLSEALPGATQAFAKALGLTEKQLFDKMKNGDVKASDALPKFAKELGAQINSRGGWKAIQDSTQTMLGNLKNTWNNSLTDIFRGSENGLQDFTRSLTTLLNALGGSGKSLGESLGSLMTDMSHGVDSLTDISYRVRAFFDEVTLAYRGLTDEQKKVVDALGSGLINSLKVLAGVIAVNKVVGVTRSIYGLMTAITRLGQVADTTADNVNRKNGKPSRLNPMNMLLAGSAIYAGYERLASTPERMEAQAKLPELAKESGLKPVFTMDDVKGWFSSAADKIAGFQEPMNNFVNNTQSTPPAITGDIVNSNAQLAMTISELSRKVDALTVEAKKPLSVNIKGEATVRPDEPAFFNFNQSANDQFTQDMLLSSSYPEEE